MVERLRGRAGVAQRKRDRARHPLCVRCLDLGHTTPTEVIDHIKPLALGGLDVPSNRRGLCRPCHHIVTQEQFNRGTGTPCDEDGWPL